MIIFGESGTVKYDRLCENNLFKQEGKFDFVRSYYAVRNLLKVSRVIPMHYGTFPPLNGTPEQFKQQLAGYDTEGIALEPGEKRNF